jgi:hypothetical protein
LFYSVNDPSFCIPAPLSAFDRRLRFDSRFESGNLDRAYQIGFDTYHLILEPDNNPNRSCQWFYFGISNIHKHTNYTFLVSGFHKPCGAHTNGAKGFWYSEKQAELGGVSWSRGGTNYAFGASVDSHHRWALEFQITFPSDNDTVYLSSALPYTFSDLLSYLRNWKMLSAELVTVTTLCRSFLGRSVPLLTIAQKNTNGKNVIFLTARCHPGESNGCVVLHRFIDYLLSNAPQARHLLARFVFRIVPMACVDEVIAGNFRVWECGSDLNRMWANRDETLHPTVWATKELSKEKTLKLYLDFHGHSRLNGTFAYGCPSEGREKIFPKHISLLSDMFSFTNCAFSIPPRGALRAGASYVKSSEWPRAFASKLPLCGVNTGRHVQVLYDEYMWKEVGAKIGEATHHFFTEQYSRLRAFAEKGLANSARKGMDEEGEEN